MTQPPQPTEQFAQHPRLAELVTALGFRRYPLFLTGLLYEEPGGPLRQATAVASRDGDLVAYDSGEVFEHAGRVPTSRLFDDDLTGRSPKTLVDGLADHNQAFFAHEVASWTRDRTDGRHGKADVSRGLGVVRGVGSVLAADLSAEEVVHGRLGCIRVRLGLQVRRGDELAVGILGAEGGRSVARQRPAVAPEFGRASRPQQR